MVPILHRTWGGAPGFWGPRAAAHPATLQGRPCDHTSSNDNEVQVSSYASTYGTDFGYRDMVEHQYYDYNSNDMVENVYDYHSSSMCDDFDNMQEERTPITTMFKSGTTKRHGTTYYGSSSRRSTEKATMHSSYGAPTTSRRRHEMDIAKSAKLRHSPSTSRRRHEKDIVKSAKLRHSTSTIRRRPKKCIDKAKPSQGPSSS